MNLRHLLRTLTDLRAGLDLRPGGRLVLRWAGSDRNRLAAQLGPEREALISCIGDEALALAWPGLPGGSLTPTLRVLLAWYALERDALTSAARRAWAVRADELVAEGWARWHAEVVALEVDLPRWRPSTGVGEAA